MLMNALCCQVECPCGEECGLTLAYWAIRGLGQPCRLLLAYTQPAGKWCETFYEQGGEDAGFAKTCWTDAKFSASLASAAGGLDFPNLPYLMDEPRGLALTQSVAIMRHIARVAPGKHLLGCGVREQALVDLLLEEVRDLKGRMTGMQYRLDVATDAGAKAFADYTQRFENLPAALGRLDAFLAKHMHGGSRRGGWAVGSSEPTIADFLLFEYLEQARCWAPGSLDAHARLGAFRARFAALPGVAEFLAAPQYEEGSAPRVVTGVPGGETFCTGFNNRHGKWRNYGKR